MVLAGPGSGKTFTITSRIEYLINRRKVRPEEILVITFTRYAATQMQLRFRSACEGRRFPVTFGTFHSVYFQILKKAYSLNGADVLTGKEKRSLLGRAAFEVLHQEQGREDFLYLLGQEIGRVKNEDTDPGTYKAMSCESGAFRQIFRVYEEEKKKQKKLDFEDMLTCCRDLLLSDQKILEEWQKKFLYILVDEFQDCNAVQYEVLKLLADPERNLFVVGDDDQSIYGFRGASPKIMQQFLRDYPDALQILLDTNYRCSEQIVVGSMKVIAHNQDRFPKKIHAAHRDGSGIRLRIFSDSGEESRSVAAEIRRLLDGGMPAKEIAVLYRTGIEGELLAELLSRQRIPFQMQSWQNNLYEHFIGRDLRSYLSLAETLGETGTEEERSDLLRIANRPNRYLARESLEEARIDKNTLLSRYQGEKGMQDRIRKLYDDLDLIKDEPPFGAIQYIREGIGYENFLKEYAGSRHLRTDQYEEVLDQIQERSKDFSSTGEWISHVDRFGEDLKEQQSGRGQEGVRLQTIHSAKGLEYDTVFLLGVNEGNIPHKNAQLPEEIEEERRLFYVAMTRAKKQLLISYVGKRNGRPAEPSRFLGELMDDYER